MTTVIIGGTFNPIHIGHLYLAEETRRQLGFERVLFIPANIPAHKDPDDSTAPEQRLEMLRRVLADSPFGVDDTEIRRGGVSYTIDTVQDLQQRYEITGKPALVIGDDLVPGLPQWRRWEELRTMIELVIAHRTRTDRVSCSWPHRYLENLILPISSRELRERIAGGRAFRYLLPPAAYRYITENGLYGLKGGSG